jgi:hypothetical protein
MLTLMPRTDIERSDLATLAALIARSQIVVPIPVRPAALRFARQSLPADFDEADIAILEWIADEARRARRSIRM